MVDYRPPSVRVEKPWGGFEQYTHNLPCSVKIITGAPAGVLSRQYHHKRDRLWVVLDPGACVELDGKGLYPDPKERFFIPRETVHRLSFIGSSPVRILEISWMSTAERRRKVSQDTARPRWRSQLSCR